MTELKKSIGYSATVCFIPILIFMVIELMNDAKYVSNNKGQLSIEYLCMGLLALLLFYYIRYTKKNDVILNPIKNDVNTEKIKQEKKILKKNVLYGLLCFYMILFTCIIYATITNNKIKAIMMFFIYAVTCLCNLAYSYERLHVYKLTGGENKEKSEKINFKEFMTYGVNSIEQPSDKIYKPFNKLTIIPALVFGVVFGFIDNAGLICGLDALDKPFGYISKLVTGTLPSKNKKGGGIFSKPSAAVNAIHEKNRVDGITSGLGNLFSDGLGVTIGAFFSKFAASIFGSSSEQPIWVDMVGISFGCIFGIMIPLSFKNLTTGQMWAKGIGFRFIKDSIIILSVIIIIILTLLKLPEEAEKKIKWEVN